MPSRCDAVLPRQRHADTDQGYPDRGADGQHRSGSRGGGWFHRSGDRQRDTDRDGNLRASVHRVNGGTSGTTVYLNVAIPAANATGNSTLTYSGRITFGYHVYNAL